MRFFIPIAIALAGLAAAEEPAAPGFTAIDDALRFDQASLTVFVFVDTDCPIANAMAPEIERIFCDTKARGVRLYRVYAGPFYDNNAVIQHAADYEYTAPAILDPEMQLVRLTGALITPEAVVYDAEGNRRYRGRISDLYADLGVKRQAASRHDLREAIEALLNNREVPRAETKAVGCFLPKAGGASEETLREEPQS
ncbi:MAG: redoxin domain-containing protein [Candidatus Hydrogenedens sp.]|nr:redoxin domain-containing protein [Candidatus Hydrogenedens sp.]